MKKRELFKSNSEHSASRISYGGETKGKRKLFRPLNPRRPIHLVMKSSQAKGKLSLLAKKLHVTRIIEAKAAKYRIKIHGMQNMGNHFHLMASFKTRQEMQKFMRVVSGLIARLMTGAQRGNPFGKRFWDHLAFTRIITGQRDFAKMLKYLTKNEVEREHGQAFRSAIELHEKAVRDAKRKGKSLAEIMDEWVAAETKKQAASQTL